LPLAPSIHPSRVLEEFGSWFPRVPSSSADPEVQAAVILEHLGTPNIGLKVAIPAGVGDGVGGGVESVTQVPKVLLVEDPNAPAFST